MGEIVDLRLHVFKRWVRRLIGTSDDAVVASVLAAAMSEITRRRLAPSPTEKDDGHGRG